MSNATNLMRQARKIPMLTPEEEQALGYAWYEYRDEDAYRRLVESHMRLAIKWGNTLARWHGRSAQDCIQEAHVGLLKAVDRFDPSKGVRLSTHAFWWIKATVQDRILRDTSLVRMGTTSGQKSAIFNLRRATKTVEQMAEHDGETLTQHEIWKRVAALLNVPLGDVETVAPRVLSGDASLNVPVGEDGLQWLDWLKDDTPQPDPDREVVAEWVQDAFSVLDERETLIVRLRKYHEPPVTLEALGDELNLSKERVRQLEVRALEKMRKHLEQTVSRDALKLELA